MRVLRLLCQQAVALPFRFVVVQVQHAAGLPMRLFGQESGEQVARVAVA